MTWVVMLENKRPSFFEHWWVAVSFAVYVARNPHVMHDVEPSIESLRSEIAKLMGGAAYISQGTVCGADLKDKFGWYVRGGNEKICIVWGHKTEREAILAGLAKAKTQPARQRIPYLGNVDRGKNAK